MDFQQVNVFSEAEEVQCHQKSEHLLCSPVKLDKKNDEAGYRIPMKAAFSSASTCNVYMKAEYR